jgi:hypothetical protein
MPETMSTVTQELCLRGEITEMFEGHGRQVARIYLNSLHLDLPMEMLGDAHLGDELLLEAKIVVKSVTPHTDQHRPDPQD